MSYVSAEIRKFLTEKTDEAHSIASDGLSVHTPRRDLRSMDATQVGGLAFLQFVLKHTHELFAEYLDDAVLRDGMLAEHLAAALAEHGVTTTGEQLRETYPRIIKLEGYVRWLGQNSHQYLPLLYVVSRLITDQPHVVPPGYRDDAQRLHANLVSALRDNEWNRDTASLNELDAGLLSVYAPHRCPWLTHVAVEMIENEADRSMARQLAVVVNAFYATGEHGCPDQPVPLGDCAAMAAATLRLAMESDSVPREDSTELLRVARQG